MPRDGAGGGGGLGGRGRVKGHTTSHRLDPSQEGVALDWTQVHFISPLKAV